MGNRKERRLAAKTGANRRVKLDLLAEPSGDFGDSSSKEEVGGAGNGKFHAGSPNSPSSSEFRHFNKISGQRPENPLLLLGQYSDEEVEEDSSKEVSHDTRENTPAELDDEGKVANHEVTRADEDENVITEKVDQENKEHSSSLDVLPTSEENGVIEDSKTESPYRDKVAVEQASVPLTSDTLTTGNVDLGWKMVLHESNSYYYWNIVTGETSWEVPAVLTQGNVSAYDHKSGPDVEEPPTSYVDTQPNNGSTKGMVIEAKGVDVSRPELEVRDEKYTYLVTNDEDKGNHTKEIDGRKMSSTDGVSYGWAHNDALDNGEAHSTDSVIQNSSDHVYQVSVSDPSSDSFRLLQLGENLLERLKSLKGSEGVSDQISKLTFELDTRLEDIKSLVPYGSSLLPFWLHSENQLKKLEASINNEVLKCSQVTDIDEMNESENKLQEEVSAHVTSSSLELDASDHTAPGTCPENAVQGETLEAHENAIPADVGLHSVEEEDMDVEMEVDDPVPFGDELAALNRSQTDVSIPHGQHESRGSEEEFGILPLPSDEWIPPPPPDDEPLPPPPPDEPSEPLFPLPPSEIQTEQPYSHVEQYSFTYPGLGFEYYGGQTNTQVQSNNYYVDANGCQVAVAAPLPTVYYAAVPNPYPDGTSAVNHMEPLTYYGLQEGSAPTAPIVGGVETTALQNSALKSIASDQKEAVTEVPFPLASAHASANSRVTRGVSVASTPAATITEPVAKVQPKVTRNKKRTVATVPTLRSNKKVSGLVDKWKAVKEELHEDEEDEPENPYEILEKKRQREIEKWHALQIASGEAKDNANFQPLGGDWRERVRRKRAKKAAEVEENQAKSSDDISEKPDLVELSKQLPAGWQAYWDKASKQVYYGNSKTSETSWTKPICS